MIEEKNVPYVKQYDEEGTLLNPILPGTFYPGKRSIKVLNTENPEVDYILLPNRHERSLALLRRRNSRKKYNKRKRIRFKR